MKLSFDRFAAWSAIVARGLQSGDRAIDTRSGQTSGQPESTASSADQPLTTVSVQVKVVNVLATVRDKHGKIVNGLNKDDFTLNEDGRPQAIKYFARETDLPLTLGLLVDTSLSQRRVLSEERDASESFLAQILREEQDKAFVIHFDRRSGIAAGPDCLARKVALPRWSRWRRRSSPAASGGGGPGPGSGRGSGRHGGRNASL